MVQVTRNVKNLVEKMKKPVIAFGIGGVLLRATVVASASSWANAQTFTVNANTVWNGVNTLGTRIGAQQTTSEARWDSHTISRSMASRPSVRLVNSGGAIRDSSMSVADDGRTVTGSHTGTAGFAYFIQVNPAWNQVTNSQSVRLQHRVR